MNKGRVLVVEDDADSLELLCEILAAAGWDAVGAADGRRALERLDADAAPALVILDLMMPGMNGWQLMDEIRARPTLARTPVVLLSADSGVADAARSLGAAGFLRKPVGMDALLETVERHARSSH